MSIQWTALDSTDADFHLAGGAGFLAEVADVLFDAEQAEAARAAIEKENSDWQAELESQRQEVEAELRFWEARAGRSLRRGPAVVLAEYAEGAARADKAQARREGLANVEDLDAPPYKSHMTAKREAYQLIDKINADPATIGDVKAVATKAHVEGLRLGQKIDRLFGRRA